uniref:Cassiicolin n=1 Tax=Corynespora cassiicola TaxID=59586 RepID=K9LDX5_CORCC|nr:cassiicolin precursor [Corynespora cassiicola]AFH88936.1 cassiicolin precursor [Corynespora cassiicola]AFH88937.1 cassiicolin precursor [Corynespora cassiicola]QKE52010.1 cassiicolin [Corynespora cassiicola]QKE52011.1 cassiicolin [Corynespora cassiicola]
MKYFPILISAFVAAVAAAPQGPSAVAAAVLPRQTCAFCEYFGNGYCGNTCTGDSWACSNC